MTLDELAIRTVFGELASDSGYFVVMLAFGTVIAFIASLQNGDLL